MTKKEKVISLEKKYVRDVPGFPKPGIIFKDIVPILESPDYFKEVIEVMIEELKANNIEFDRIISPEARGFLFGVPIGLLTGKGIALARKPGKLPYPGYSVTYDLEYGTETLVISKDTIKPGERVLVVDDLLATGGSAKGCCSLVEQSGATVAGIMFYLELTPLKGREFLKDYKVFSVVPINEY